MSATLFPEISILAGLATGAIFWRFWRSGRTAALLAALSLLPIAVLFTRPGYTVAAVCTSVVHFGLSVTFLAALAAVRRESTTTGTAAAALTLGFSILGLVLLFLGSVMNFLLH